MSAMVLEDGHGHGHAGKSDILIGIEKERRRGERGTDTQIYRQIGRCTID